MPPFKKNSCIFFGLKNNFFFYHKLMNSRTDPILAQRRVILVSLTDNSIQLEQFINANMAKCQCVVKGIWAFSLFFPREIDSFALELWFIVDFFCQIVFLKMGNKFPSDVTATDDGEPPPPPLYHPCRSPWRVLTALWIILFPRACVSCPSERWSDQNNERSQSRTQSLRAFWSAG